MFVFLFMILHQVKGSQEQEKHPSQVRGDTCQKVTIFTRFEWGTFVLSNVTFPFPYPLGKVILAECLPIQSIPKAVLIMRYADIRSVEAYEQFYVATAKIEHCRILRFLLPLPPFLPLRSPILETDHFQHKSICILVNVTISHGWGAFGGQQWGATGFISHPPVHHWPLVLGLLACCRSVFLLLHCPLAALMKQQGCTNPRGGAVSGTGAASQVKIPCWKRMALHRVPFSRKYPEDSDLWGQPWFLSKVPEGYFKIFIP